MRERRFTSADFTPESVIPDAVLDANDPVMEMARLAGTQVNWKQYDGMNASVTGTEKRELERQNNIQPGTPEWFQLWFSLPYMTGEPPVKR